MCIAKALLLAVIGGFLGVMSSVVEERGYVRPPWGLVLAAALLTGLGFLMLWGTL